MGGGPVAERSAKGKKKRIDLMSVSSYLKQVLRQKTFDIRIRRGPEAATSALQVGDVIRIDEDIDVGGEVVPFGKYLILLSDQDGTVLIREVDTRGRAGDAYEFNDNDLIGPTSDLTGFVVYGSVPLIGVPMDARDGSFSYRGLRRSKKAARRKVTKKKAAKRKVTKRKAAKRKAAKRGR